MTDLTTNQTQWLLAMYKDAQGEYLLPDVQEPCAAPAVYYKGQHRTQNWETRVWSACPNCYGLGWTPTKDAWAWITGYDELTHRRTHSRTRHTAILYAVWKGPTAFFSALHQALTPLAVNAEEARKFVEESISGR